MTEIISKSSILLVTLGFLLALTGCDSTSVATIVTPKGSVIAIEVASTPDQQARGLMNRKTLADDSGMLFVFDRERDLSFWMKNTLIPLDALFLDEKGVIVDILTMSLCPPEAAQCPNYSAKEKAKYVLEINAGQATNLELKTGDTLTLHIPINDQSPTR